MNKYVKIILFMIIVFPFKELIKKLDDTEFNKKFKDDLDIVKKYLINGENASKVNHSLKPKLWIYVPYKVNSRKWESFYTRNNEHLNQPYINLTIKSIVDKCDSSFDVALIDDNSFEHLFSKEELEMNKSLFNKNKHIEYMNMLLIKYGGFVVPCSFLCTKNLIDLYNQGVAHSGCFVIENVCNNPQGKTFCPDPSFMGSTQNNKVIQKLLHHRQNINKEQSDEHIFLNNISNWCLNEVNNKTMSYIDGSLIGVKKTDGSPVHIEDIINTSIPQLRKDLFGIYINSNKLIKQHKYSWFTYLSEDKLLSSNTVFTKYLLSSY